MNVKTQEAVVYVIPASRHELDHDIIKVDTTFLTDTPFPTGEIMFVPSKDKKVPKAILSLLNENGFDFGPKLASQITPKLKDFPTEVLDPKKANETRQDALLGYLVTYLDQIKLTPLNGEKGTYYNISYEFPLYPNEAGEFEFMTSIPLAGLTAASNLALELMIVLPSNTTFDPKETKGITSSGGEIVEKPFQTEDNRSIVTFHEKVDPDFYVTYKY